jgi:hypothetical protein
LLDFPFTRLDLLRAHVPVAGAWKGLPKPAFHSKLLIVLH